MNSKDEPVVILAGGMGMRMREHTESTPKALVPIGPYPVIYHVMKCFENYGYKKFILCLGYKGKDIKQYFIDHEWVTGDFHLNDFAIEFSSISITPKVVIVCTALTVPILFIFS